MITSALFTTKKPTPTHTFTISPHILVIGKLVSLAVNLLRLRRLCSEETDFLEKVGEMVFFLNNVDTFLLCCKMIFMSSDGLTRLMSWAITARLHKGRIGFSRFLLTIHWMKESKESYFATLTFWLVTLKPGKCFHNHRWSPIAETATSVISLCVLGTAANPVLRRVYPCLHACCRNCQHVSSDTNVCGPQCSFFIKKAFSCQTSRLVYCISCRCCLAIYIGETGHTRRQHFGEHNQIIEKNLPTDTLVHGIMLCGENVQYKCPEMRLIFHFDTSHPSGLNSDFRFL